MNQPEPQFCKRIRYHVQGLRPNTLLGLVTEKDGFLEITTAHGKTTIAKEILISIEPTQIPFKCNKVKE